MTALPSLKHLEVRQPHKWLKHLGGNCPVNPETLVMIRYRNGMEKGPIQAKSRRWVRWPDGECDFDIVSFKIVEAGE